MKKSDKQKQKKLRESAKFHKRSSGRRAPLPPNRVIADEKKKLDKSRAREYDSGESSSGTGYGGWGHDE